MTGATSVAVDFDFDSEPENPGLPPTCTFRLGEQVWEVKNDAYLDLSLVHRMFSDQGMQVQTFFREVLVDGQWDAFEQMLAAPPEGLTIGKARRAMSRVVEKILGFPTQASESSPTTSTEKPRKAKSSTGRSSSPGTRRKASGE